METCYTIYKITNIINNKIYIGSHKTKVLDDGYMGSGTNLKRSMNKYGIENFQKEILFIYNNPEEMYVKEKELVNEEFIADKNTYNIKEGGCGGFDHINKTGKNIYGYNGRTHNSKEDLKRARKKLQWLMDSDEEYSKRIKEKISNSLKGRTGTFTGKTHSEEVRRIISENSKIKQAGARNSQYGTMWINNGVIEKKIHKNDSFDNNEWKRGKLESHLNNIKKEKLKEQKKKQREEEYDAHLVYLRNLHEIYIKDGFSAIKETGYKCSLQNLVTSFNKHLPEFIPQNRKRRNK